MGSSQMEDRSVPPHSIEAEVCLLGSMILDVSCIDVAVQITKSGHFYRPAHEIVFDALVDMRDRSDPVDLVLLREEITKRGLLDRVGGVEYLVALVEGVPTAANAEYYARIVRDKAILRELILVGLSIVREAQGTEAGSANAVEEAEKRIFSIASQQVGKDPVTVDVPLEEVFKILETLDGEQITGVGSGYQGLDRLTRGFQNGELIVVAARPAMGKTSLLLNFLEHMAVIDKGRAVIFSLEMSQKQLAQRLLASHARYDMWRMMTGRMSPDDWTGLQTAADDLYGSGIFIDDSPELTAMQIRAKARRLKSQENIQCIFIDYLQLICSHGRPENRQVEVAEMSRSLKAMARELNVPVVTAAQLNRKPADRPSRRPQMSDLRESGAIEQDADVVMLLHREDYYHEGETGYAPTGLTELILAKQRNGPTGTVPLVFLKGCTRFEPAADSQ